MSAPETGPEPTRRPQPRAGQWLYSTCGADYYGEILRVGEDANGQPVIDIRVEDPQNLIWCESVEMGETAGPDDWENPLTTVELPDGLKPILRNVLYRMTEPVPYECGGYETIRVNTPGDGCYRCTKWFWIHEAEEARRGA